MSRLLYIVLLIILLVSVPDAVCKTKIIQPADSIYIRALDYYDESEDSSTIIEITYPQVLGISDSVIEYKINSLLEEEFLKSVEWYEEFVSMLDSVPTMEYTAGMFFSFETGFDIKLVSESFLSIVLNQYEFTGGAHGNYYSIGYNFDLTTGNLITVENVLNAESLSFISRLCEVKIKQIYEAVSLTDAGLFEDRIELTTDQDFYLLKDAIVFQFDPYEIAPYAMGNIEVPVYYEEISEFLLIKSLLTIADEK